VVNRDLPLSVSPDQGWRDVRTDILHRLPRAFSEVPRFFAIAKLNGFMFAGGGAGWNRGSSHAAVGEKNIRFNGRIAAAIENFATYDSGDFHDVKLSD
jgi:hypothetical protein